MCTFKAARKDNVENHKIARHYDGQNIDCDQCYKSFANKDYFEIHKDVIHKGKIFSSDIIS